MKCQNLQPSTYEGPLHLVLCVQFNPGDAQLIGVAATLIVFKCYLMRIGFQYIYCLLEPLLLIVRIFIFGIPFKMRGHWVLNLQILTLLKADICLSSANIGL